MPVLPGIGPARAHAVDLDVGEAIDLGIPVQQLARQPLLARVRRCKEVFESDKLEEMNTFMEEVKREFEQIRLEYAQSQEHAP